MKQTGEPTLKEPRWGSEYRPLKAEAIWQTLLHYAGPEINKGLWVDIGCGSGGIAAALAPQVGQIIGIDPEPWARWADWTRENPNLKFIQGSYDNEPPLLKADSADIVICNQVYEHVPDPQRMIAEIYRILKPGGFCYFAGPNLLFPIEPHVFWPFVHWLPRTIATRLMKAVGSNAILDAYSTHYWRLYHWLHLFQTQNAVPYILSHPWTYKRSGLLWRLASRVPNYVLHFLTPLSPGFVFVLYKRPE